MKMQFIDLETQQRRIRSEIDKRIARVLDHGNYIMGPEVRELETELGAYVDAEHAISCSSGTDALLMPLMAMGVGPGDVVITSPFTFMATAEVITLLGATPVFVDIDPRTFNLDVDQLRTAIRAVRENDSSIYPLPRNHSFAGSRIAAIISVDIFGLPADYGQLEPLCIEEGIPLIEDAAQSFGAEMDGRKACSFGKVAATSFFPAKPFGCYGDGGMIFTDDANLADKMRSIRVHGKGEDKYDNKRIGLNARLDTIQAAIMLAKWEIFPDEVQARQHVAARYGRLIGEKLPTIGAPVVPETYRSAWAQYTIRCNGSRADFQESLAEASIPTAIYYPLPLHLQTAYEGLGYKEGDLPESEAASKDVLSLPFSPYLKDEDMDAVVDVLGRS